MNKTKGKITRYQVKAVVFDIQEECKELKKELAEAGIAVIIPFFGLRVEQTLREMPADTEFGLNDCLLITNNQQHAKIASELGMAVACCVEGHFEVPMAVTLFEAPA